MFGTDRANDAEWTEARRPVAGVGLERLERLGTAMWSGMLFQHTDHQGSIVAYTDANGAVVARMAFDPWGRRSDPLTGPSASWNAWASLAPPDWIAQMTSLTPRGFTGHEHHDDHGIINMNGRIYDPMLGRFLQADPFLESTTTLNRYTYVHNNPLRYTDPSGYFSLGDFVNIGMSVMIATATGGAAGSLLVKYGAIQAAAYVAVGGAVSGAVTSGTWKGAKTGAFTSVASFGIGRGLANFDWAQGNFVGKLSKAGYAAKIVAHGTVGGITADMQGGKFGHGFVSSAASSSAAPFIGANFGVADGAVVSALIGGTVSEISGGDFANGAITSAMQFILNQCSGGSCGNSDSDTLTEHSGFGIRSNVYFMMDKAISALGIDAVWFRVAADLNRAFGSAPDIAVADYLNGLGQDLLLHNVRTFAQVISGGWAGQGAQGQALDFALVDREQTLVQNYLDTNEPGFFEQGHINASFSSPLRLSMFATNPRLGAALTAADGGAGMNFFNQESRVRLGQSMMIFERNR
ncbi:hypothetical protein HFP89_05585 [Wenzhouxiangella sp. XN79A]|uniref:RHS repeat domain-containing protein n=1 Tax=Wenzhouxiangella sp. XN79A TaxID=2724193 RepID=UPI00144A9C21|nr:RHS repeat-associated core domain-containing protein [Wenzhouxiangella sp. XN79A]NKI34634.1 hypothetical protein [Wenzhouxiangella sp. XN79A]